MDDRKKAIKELQDKAEKVLKLKNERRQKRPIVIEFSGSPKSGKTSCINSLELFLKRNGFKVKTIQERASVCPVSDKLSPMFNIWTACMSLSGMVGVLEDKTNCMDVLILDRGIFDALCWFNWLVTKGKMEKDQLAIVENFLLMDDLVKPIDIVFSFTADPETSIEREYTHLLTDRLGSIMNEAVLTEYKNSVIETQNAKSSFFHKIFVIDTTAKNQDDVGKEVTEKTLESLNDLLVEKVAVIKKTNKLTELLNAGGVIEFDKLEGCIGNLEYINRDDAEKSDKYIQPIPIAVITDKEKKKVFVIKKNDNAVSKLSPEKGKTLLYIGGHSRFEDSTEKISKDFLSLCKSTLKREAKEEIGISIALNDIKPFVIYSEETDKSKIHMGICFVVCQDINENELRLDRTELILRKGKSKSGTFQLVDSLSMDGMEAWSRKILTHVFGKLGNKQMSMFGD